MSSSPAGDQPQPGPELTLEGFLPYRLAILSSIVSQALSGLYSERYGLSIPEWRVLATLGQFGTTTAKQIGLHSRMHKTKVSRAVAALEKRKLIQRRSNRQDLREIFLTLSREGRAIYGELVPSALAFTGDLVRDLSPAERASLDALLTKLTDRASELLGEGAGSAAAWRE